MKVILLQDVKGSGKKGDVIEAKDGYCQNFLFPKKLAAPANKSNMNILVRERKQLLESKQKVFESCREISDKINLKTFTTEVKTGENGKLFGSVTNKEISALIEEATGIIIDKKKILLDEPLKTTGEHEVQIKIHPEIETKIIVSLKSM